MYNLTRGNKPQIHESVNIFGIQGGWGGLNEQLNSCN